jgi:hydroxypyruvate isomerase
MFNEWSFLDRFAAATDNGFSAVEYLFPYEHPPEAIADRLQTHHLEQALFNAPAGDWAGGDRGLACIPERREDFEAAIRKALVYAAAVGLKRLHVMAGIGSRDNPQQQQCYEQTLLYACVLAAARGLDIPIEPINQRDMPGYFLNDFGYAGQLVERLRCPNLKLQFDVYHRQIMHGDVPKSLEAFMPTIGHVQIASVPGRNEPGSGELDDARVLTALDGLAYIGFVGCEYRPQGQTVDGLAWRQQLGFEGDFA